MTREEAIKTIRLTCPKISDSECDFETAMRFLIPELAESEKEKIRREIVDFICWAIDRGSITEEQRERSDTWLAYLEKQKEPENVSATTMAPSCLAEEQKPAEPTGKLSREEYLYQLLIDQLITYSDYEYLTGKKPAEIAPNQFDGITYGMQEHSIEKSAERFEKAREKYQVEWSDNDDQLIGFIFDLLNDLAWRKDWAMSKEECLERLKSLTMRCPKSSDNWRPSEEQMEVLYGILVGCRGTWGKDTVTTMESLYQNLKKLM